MPIKVLVLLVVTIHFVNLVSILILLFIHQFRQVVIKRRKLIICAIEFLLFASNELVAAVRTCLFLQTFVVDEFTFHAYFIKVLVELGLDLICVELRQRQSAHLQRRLQLIKPRACSRSKILHTIRLSISEKLRMNSRTH